jgi:dsDNA-specific endonuclease/ATPase MutS2
MTDEPGPDTPIELTLTDVLDLHSFPPGEVADVVRSYLEVAEENDWSQVRIIHGKGRGVQRQTVRKMLERDPRVISFADAPGNAGGWGATLVTLRRSSD